jgi:hypothetical protein
MARPRRGPQRSIQAFTTVTKASATLSVANKKRKHHDEESVPAIFNISTTLKKRKVAIITPPDTPTKVVRSSVAQISVSTSITNLKRKRHASPEVDIAISSPPESSTECDSLPAEVEDLKRLNSAFLSSLSLHYAHNGNSSSVDLRMITPSITRLWAKRKATIDDIRRLVAIIHLTSTKKSQSVVRFALKDFGEGKVCLEIVAKRRGLKSTANTLNEADTNALFSANLEHAWESSPNRSEGPAAFIASLPLEPLSMAATVAKIAPLQAKGQRRLEEVLTPFKNFNISDSPASPNRVAKRVKSDHLSSMNLPMRTAEKENTQPEAPKDRSHSLLERIQKKEAIAALMPAGPTKEQRDHMAALQRAEEMLEILNLLAVAKGGASRTSFPLGSLVGSIQSSIRSPMAKDEVLRCVTVLTTEIAPGHISMVTFGSVIGVVVDRNRKPQSAEIKTRLSQRGV